MGIYQLKNDVLTICISSHGAEMISVTDQNGRERLWQGKSNAWQEHAPLLFPICGGLKEDSYLLDGVKYQMPKHGFAKNAEWTLWEETAQSLTFLLTEKTEGFPFAYRLFAQYTLCGNEIEIVYRCVNQDKRTFWYGIGSHEGYAIEGELEEYSITLEKPETLHLSSQVGNLLLPEEYLFAKNTDRFPLNPAYFTDGAMILRSIKSRRITLTRQDRALVTVDFPDMSVIILWTKPGEEFLCIEPWTVAPDLITADGVLAHKPGITALGPGEERVHRHRVCFAV